MLDAKYTLGERMVAAGIDDGHLGTQIALLDARIRQVSKTSALQEALLADRKMLVLRLADAALEVDAPLPGADAEYQKVRNCEATLHAADEQKLLSAGSAKFMAGLWRHASSERSGKSVAPALAVRQ